MLLSFVVPVYNTKKDFLSRCLDSLLNQKNVDFEYEIIVINDGSDSEETINYLSRINNEIIKILNKTNGGVSSSRNMGIELARGDFISFVDADDYLKDNFLEESKKHLSDNLDILYINNAISYKNKIKKDSINSKYVVWSKIFRKKFITDNKIFFNEDLSFCEDFLFMETSSKFSKKIYHLTESLYVYCKNEYNASTKCDPDCYIKFSDSLSAMKPFFDDNEFRKTCLMFYLDYVIPKAIFHKEIKLKNSEKKKLAKNVLYDTNLNFHYGLEIKKGAVNYIRYFQLVLLKHECFIMVNIINRLIIFLKKVF